jgi:hypothetical protein
MMLIVLVIASFLHLTQRPYLEDSHLNELELMTLFLSILVLSCGLMYAEPGFQVLFVCTLYFVLDFVCMLVPCTCCFLVLWNLI